MITPLSLFLTMSMPPTTLYRTEHLRRHADTFLDPRTPLLNERTLLARLASDQTVVAEPFIGGLFRHHNGQQSYLGQLDGNQLSGRAVAAEWPIMAEALDKIWQTQADRHDDLVADIISRFADHHILECYHRATQASGPNGLLRHVSGILRQVAARRGLDLDPPPPPPLPPSLRAKEVVRACTPPIVWSTLRKLVRRTANGR